MPKDHPRSKATDTGNITGIAAEVTLARELDWKDGLMIGIGGMIGAGVFSVLGLSTSIAGPSVILSFIFGGFMALLTGYSYSKLAVLFPRAGGSYIFVDNAFNKRWLSGLVGWVLWTAYIIACALYAFTFGAYFTGMLTVLLAPFINIHPVAFFLKKILTIILIIFFLNLNLKGVKETTSLQNKIVITKVVILVFFIIAGILGMFSIGLKNLVGNGPSPDWSIFFPSGTFAFVIAATLIFIAYEGFELILNAADEMVEPKKDVPKAIYVSVLAVWVIYVLVALVAVGNLPYGDINAENAEYALALAAEPVLGSMGFVLISIGALFSTASAFNASLFGSSRLAFDMAKERFFPRNFVKLNKNRVPSKSLILIALVTIAISITLELENIASAASVAFLAIFCMVNTSALVMRKKAKLGKTAIVPAVALVASIISLCGLVMYYAGENNWLALGYLVLYFAIVIVINTLNIYYSGKK